MINNIKVVIKYILSFRARIALGSLGSNSKIFYPTIIEHGKYMHVRNNVYIMRDARIQLIPYFKDATPYFEIGDNSHINRFCHIVATHKLTIGKGVGIGDCVMIADATHEFQDISKSYLYQPLKYLGEVSIGDETWVGRCVTIQGCKIGRHCVIGSNAFVTKDIPDYCVVVGSPARIIKRYNFETKQWEKTDKDGNFLQVSSNN